MQIKGYIYYRYILYVLRKTAKWLSQKKNKEQWVQGISQLLANAIKFKSLRGSGILIRE